MCGDLPKQAALPAGLIYWSEALKFCVVLYFHWILRMWNGQYCIYSSLNPWRVSIKYSLQWKIMCIFPVTWVGTSLNTSPIQYRDELSLEKCKVLLLGLIAISNQIFKNLINSLWISNDRFTPAVIHTFKDHYAKQCCQHQRKNGCQ